jgi:hypothetical protein
MIKVGDANAHNSLALAKIQKPFQGSTSLYIVLMREMLVAGPYFLYKNTSMIMGGQHAQDLSPIALWAPNFMCAPDGSFLRVLQMAYHYVFTIVCAPDGLLLCVLQMGTALGSARTCNHGHRL